MQEYELDEVHDPQAKTGLALTVVLSAIFWGCMFWEGRFDREDILLLVVTMTAITFVPILVFLLALKARLHIDETGVTVHIPFRRDLALTWAEIRTAARVHLQTNKLPLIVLSPLVPQEVLKRSRFIWDSGRKVGEIRLVYTEKRRIAVERWLNRPLTKADL